MMIAIAAFFNTTAQVREETFADAFRPFKVSYLYKLVDEHVEHQQELNEMFEIKEMHNVKRGYKKKILAYSLFWKLDQRKGKKGAQPEVNQATIYQNYPTIKKGKSFYTVYVKPLIRQLRIFKKFYPDWISRIYLAHDLKFLIPQLSLPDVEIFVMTSSSIGASPGSMWRFLVFDDPHVSMAYVKDADYAPGRVDGDFSHTKRVLSWANSPSTQGFFRLRDLGFLAKVQIPVYKRYSPIVASSFGGKKVNWINMEKAMKGFILHRRLFPDEPRHYKDIPFRGHPYGFGNEFPTYGFDERFLKHVLYFAAADKNQLTLIPTDHLEYGGRNLPPNHWVRLDLKYTKYKIF